MDTIFKNSENSKTSKSHVLILKLTNEKVIALWRNIRSSYNNNKFKISAPTWNDVFELPDG